jgi:hypothetical protein
VELGKVAVVLRPRSPWEAIDLGFTLLRQWWRPVYTAFAPVYLPIVAVAVLIGWASDRFWIALIVVWWLKPLYDRALLHLLSRAVFGELPSARAALTGAWEWLGTGLFGALTWARFDLARSFNLPVRQLEGQTGREGRARRALLARRVRSYAVWLTVVCANFEAMLFFSEDFLLNLFLPAADQTSMLDVFRDAASVANVISVEDVLVYAVVVAIVEPLYVAAGFALYLNRRTLLEGWDIEVALRRLAETVQAQKRRYSAAAAALLLAVFFGLPAPDSALAAEERNPREEIREVLKAPEFGRDRETATWIRRQSPSPEKPVDMSWLAAVGYAFAKAAEVLLWIGVAALAILALWWLYRFLPGESEPAPEPYRPPALLFGLEVAPETLPRDVPAAALALLREGKIREALSLLYRGALSELAHGRQVALLTSDTEQEVLERARGRLSAGAGSYFALLVAAWQAAAYARRVPAPAQVERLAHDYAANLGAAGA